MHSRKLASLRSWFCYGRYASQPITYGQIGFNLRINNASLIYTKRTSLCPFIPSIDREVFILFFVISLLGTLRNGRIHLIRNTRSSAMAIFMSSRKMGIVKKTDHFYPGIEQTQWLFEIGRVWNKNFCFARIKIPESSDTMLMWKID